MRLVESILIYCECLLRSSKHKDLKQGCLLSIGIKMYWQEFESLGKNLTDLYQTPFSEKTASESSHSLSPTI